MKKLFRKEVDQELSRYKNIKREIITEADLSKLPEPVKKYFKACNLIGTEKASYAEIIWEEFNLRLSFEGPLKNADCRQYNFVKTPARLVFMQTHLGLIPFDGRDKFQDGHGNMLIKLLKFITLSNSSGPEMDHSALVTILAETVLVPSYALSDYISWTPINEHSTKATLSYKDIEVSGVFDFDETGFCKSFISEDRFYTEKNNTYKKTKWSVTIEGYAEKNGIKIPTTMSTQWYFNDHVFEYFYGKIKEIRNNFKINL